MSLQPASNGRYPTPHHSHSLEKQTNTKWNDPGNLTPETKGGKGSDAAVVISKLCCLGSDFSDRTGKEHAVKLVPTFRHAVHCTGIFTTI